MKLRLASNLSILLIFVGVIVVWAIVPILLHELLGSLNRTAQFGDSYGPINSLFSGLAFAGLIVAILLQRQELKLQREELALTRSELKRSAGAQEQSGNYLGEQSEVMKVTAEINALTSIIQALNAQLDFLNKTKDMGSDTERLRKIIELEERRDKHIHIHDLELLFHAVRCASEVEYPPEKIKKH